MKTAQDLLNEAQAILASVTALVADLQVVVDAPNSTPVVAPEDVEVDLVLSDGTTKTFVPKVD